MRGKKTLTSGQGPEANHFGENDRIIVAGASAGGVAALKALISSLPENFETPVFIVWHMPAEITGMLPKVLNGCSGLQAAHGTDDEPIKKRRIYIAPPDHHMLLEKGRVRISRGPKENRFRPAIDPLFRSAAAAYGNRVIGIVLTGGLDDGTAGLWSIKEHGGTAIIQNPEEAEAPSMPLHAIAAVKADHIGGIKEIAGLLQNITATPVKRSKEMSRDKNLVKKEIDAVLQETGSKTGITLFGEATQYACPECHGVLSAIKESGRVRYRCHTGHAYSQHALLAEINTNVEDSLWNALRGMGEAVMMLNSAGDRLAAANKPKEAAVYFKEAIAAEEKIQLLNELLKQHNPHKALIENEILYAANKNE